MLSLFEGFSEQYLLIMVGLWIGLLSVLIAFVLVRLRKTRSRRSRWAAKIGLLVWTILFLATLAETVFALGYDTTDSFGLTLQSQRWHRRHCVTNDWGFRDAKNFHADKREGTSRMILLGDSFTYGQGIERVEDRFGDRLEKLIHQAGFKNSEIYTFAEGGADTGTELRLLSDLDRRGLEADWLLLVYVLNDIETLVPESVYMIGTIILDTPSNFFLREFYLPNFLYYRVKQFSRPELQNYFGWLQNAYQGAPWKKQSERLDQFRNWCEKRNTKLLVVTFPFLQQLGPNYRFRAAHQTLADYWRQHNVPHLDLLEVFEDTNSGDLIVNRFDSHPNENAHRVAADAIMDRLIRPLLDRPADRSGLRP